MHRSLKVFLCTHPDTLYIILVAVPEPPYQHQYREEYLHKQPVGDFSLEGWGDILSRNIGNIFH